MDQLPRLPFLGHWTVLIELAGLRILTDPVLFDRIGPLRRVVTSLGPDLYARIDLLVSHLHLDPERLIDFLERPGVPAGKPRVGWRRP